MIDDDDDGGVGGVISFSIRGMIMFILSIFFVRCAVFSL